MTDDASRLTAALADRYTIERELGAGGMATVYLAHDIKHDRKVAIKVLRPELAAVLGAERFVQEITTTANLQHPHILPLFDSGEADSFLYYVMPYIEGETLRDKLDRETQLGIEEAVKITTDVADALDYAHRNNVIHRDIKPENILMHDSRPMVADFGIALAVSAAAGGRMTETGLSLGTPHYMSPEQATAEKDLTNRSDIYSLGSVLYEMLTGSPPHVGSSAQQIIMKIVAEEVQPVTALRKSVPPNVGAATAKALEKLAADRFESAAKFGEALTNTVFTLPTMQAAPVAGSRTTGMWNRLSVGLAVVAVLLLLTTAWGWLRPPPSTHPVRFTIPVPGGHEMAEAERSSLAVSPDGRFVVYGENGGLVLRELAQETAEPLAGTNGADNPFFSPDGESVGFLQIGVFKRMRSEGGVITPIGNAPGDTYGADWGEDGFLVYGRGAQGIWRLPVAEGEPEPITTLTGHSDENQHMWPQSLAGGSLLLFSVIGTSGKWHDSKVVLKDLRTGERTTVVEDAAYGYYVPSGHVVYANEDGTILAVPFDLGAKAQTGESFPVESGVQVGQWGGGASFAVSDAGVMAFVRGNTWERHLHYWFDRTGRRLSQFGPPAAAAWGLEIEPGGRRVAMTLPNQLNDDVYLLEEGMVTPRRLTFGAGSEGWPVWSPDGARIAWQSDAGDGRGHRVLTMDVDGDAEPEILYESENAIWPRSWSPDGQWLAVSEGWAATGTDVYVVAVDDPAIRIPIHTTPSEEWNPQFSPDGAWLAYESNEGGTSQVYVVSFPNVSDPIRVSTVKGRSARWAPSGSELFFWQDTILIAATVRTEPRFAVDDIRPLFVVPEHPDEAGSYAVTNDGERFLIRVKNPTSIAREIHVVLNWFEELKAKVGN